MSVQYIKGDLIILSLSLRTEAFVLERIDIQITLKDRL